MSGGGRAVGGGRTGALASTKAVIAPGGALRVGRTDRADLVIAHDPRLAGVHFELAWDGARCRFRDLSSVAGTTLDGEAVTEGAVKHGAWIRAGETTFMV